ncbi:hypothetical protein ACFQGT_09485 [Natrialbaceae archaeon GCM10025810]|uniref:DUF7344 domain-containing protein n=1 Tax=Halovalidus salilacus TaxID=3075124 RepID=UPI003608C43E
MDETFERRLETSADDLGLSVDEMLRLLGSEHVRVVVAHLFERPEVTLEELAEVAVAATAAEEGRIATDREYERVRITLFHSTLPRLEDHGLLTFDTEGRVVENAEIPRSLYTFVRTTA